MFSGRIDTLYRIKDSNGNKSNTISSNIMYLLYYYLAGHQVLASTKEKLKGKYEIKCNVSILFYV
jgi:hypothetical protein